MSRKAVQDSLRPALLVLMMAAVSGCGQPTALRHHTTQLFTRSSEPVLAPREYPVHHPESLPGDTYVDRLDADPVVGVAQYAHALERMRENFQFPEVRHARLDRQLAWYQRNARTLRHALDRADPFMAWILDQIEAQGLPAELALLPVIESGYQPLAASPSHAAGLWQFMPSTGSRFGLEQNRWYDGRRDVVDSTQAALEYLTYLRDEFDGDWLLALAAYNAGEGTVGRAVRRNRERGLPTDYWHLDLPAQTQEYVPKLLALRDIVATPGHYGIALPDLDASSQIALVETSSRMDLGKAASMAGITLADVQRLNPGLRQATTPPQGPHRLVVPLDVADRFAAHLADLSDADEPAQSGNAAPTRVEARVASARRDTVTAGSRPQATSRTSVAVRDRQPMEYTVRRGDSLIQISRRYRVTISDLREWNGLSASEYLQPGQKLNLYLDVSLRADGSDG